MFKQGRQSSSIEIYNGKIDNKKLSRNEIGLQGLVFFRVAKCGKKSTSKTFSQKMSEAEALEAIERERAESLRREKISHYRQTGETVEIIPPSQSGKTRDKVAEAVGIGSGRTYDKAARIWEAAKLFWLLKALASM